VHASRVFVVGTLIGTVADTLPAERKGTFPDLFPQMDAADLEGCAVITDVDRAVVPQRSSVRGASRAGTSRGSARPAGRRS
jgi:hypothetical protein